MKTTVKEPSEYSAYSREKASMLTSRVSACQAEMLTAEVSQKSVSGYPLTDAFITDYLPFVKSLIGTYINDAHKYDFDSLLSVATEAFLLAIKKYAAENGAFINFAAVVIKRRLINEVTKQNARRKHEISLGAMASTDSDGDEVAYEITDERATWDNPLKWEIEAIKTESKQYGIDFFKLSKYSPKADKTKPECFAAVKYLIHNDKLLQIMRQKSLLPLKELCEATGISRKTLERHRQYLIVVALVGTDDYPYLQSWLELRKYGVLP